MTISSLKIILILPYILFVCIVLIFACNPIVVFVTSILGLFEYLIRNILRLDHNIEDLLVMKFVKFLFDTNKKIIRFFKGNNSRVNHNIPVASTRVAQPVASSLAEGVLNSINNLNHSDIEIFSNIFKFDYKNPLELNKFKFFLKSFIISDAFELKSNSIKNGLKFLFIDEYIDSILYLDLDYKNIENELLLFIDSTISNVIFYHKIKDILLPTKDEEIRRLYHEDYEKHYQEYNEDFDKFYTSYKDTNLDTHEYISLYLKKNNIDGYLHVVDNNTIEDKEIELNVSISNNSPIVTNRLFRSNSLNNIDSNPINKYLINNTDIASTSNSSVNSKYKRSNSTGKFVFIA